MVEDKIERLDKLLTELKSFVVAFSGGVDSSFLLYRANTLKKLNITGVTIRTPYIPGIEIDEAVKFAKTYGIKHRIIDLSFHESMRHNPVDRCYLCKKILFSELLSFAADNGYLHVIDGSNVDDTGDFRPGLRALRELDIRSPMLEAGLTKNNIRELLRNEGISVWDKPANACLLTRIPYDTQVSKDKLKMIEQAEYFLMEKGCMGARVRIHGDLARIECLPAYFEKFIQNPDKEQIIKQLKKIGFRYVSLDLEGYRSGSLNPEIDSL
jgi:uncharacterized protein